MKEKLRDYIDTIFTDAPNTERVHELKEEMLTNLNDKFDDLVAQGKSEAAAFNVAIAGIGDVSQLIHDTSAAPTEYVGDEEQSLSAGEKATGTINHISPEVQKKVEKYKQRSAILTSVAIALYIMCVVPVILLQNIAGVVLMFLLIAVATCLLIFNSMTKPEKTVAGTYQKQEGETDKTEKDPVFRAISGAIWSVTVCVYLGVSFLTGAWWITWLIFLIAAAVENIIKAAIAMRR